MLRWVWLSLPLLVGCSDPNPSGNAPPPCLDGGIDLACTPAYPATYDALYTNTFQKSCAASGVSCHAATGRQGGIDFSNPDVAYTALTERVVKPGAPECSILVHRVISTNGKVRMPPGRSLPPGEQCAIIKWIAEGAHR